MSDSTEATLPKSELATKDWVSREDIDTERRIEKAFHEQTQFLTAKIDAVIERLDQKIDNQNIKIDAQTKWLVGLMLTMTIAILVAVLFK